MSKKKASRVPKPTKIRNAEWIDGLAKNHDHPTTFEIPTAYEKSRIAKGDHVKVGLERKKANKGGFGGERFWLKVSKVWKNEPEGNIIAIEGKVDNDLVEFPHLSTATVVVELRHVIGTM